ncbi:MAG: 30S ribosome-binding factor RbfA [Campylobacterales bacterium]
MKNIKELRTASILREIIGEALGQLRDERMHGLNVVRVEVSKGRSNATVYLDPTGIDEEQKQPLLTQLRKARGFLSRYCASVEGWRRTPNLDFRFDDEVDRADALERIFEAIKERT